MDKSTKTALLVVVSLFLLCACTVSTFLFAGLWSFGNVVRWVDNSTTENPQEAVKIGSEIADFVIPEGFDSPYGVHFGDVNMIGYTSQSERSYILLAQFPKGTSINVDEMLRQISEGNGDPNSIWYKTETKLIEERPVTIRGQECNLSISEGTSSDGITYRTATAKFQGNGGPALVMVASQLAEWDMVLVETFISSIE
jgi:hypothetical protein